MPGGNSLPALGAALLWGGGDFAGGSAVKSGGADGRAAARVVLIGHMASLAVLVATMLALHHVWTGGRPAVWAFASGIVASLSLIGFYVALSRGAMGASAAISGVLAAAVPAIASSFLDGRPSAVKLLGFLLAAAAIWLIAAPGGDHAPTNRPAFGLAVASGIGFGVYFTALRFSSPLGELEPMTLARCGSAGTALLLVAADLLTRRRAAVQAFSRFSRVTLLWTLAGAALDTSANMLFVLATRSGRLDVAAVLASLYPVPTIVLAAVLLREHLQRQQWIGMALGGAAVVLIAA